MRAVTSLGRLARRESTTPQSVSGGPRDNVPLSGYTHRNSLWATQLSRLRPTTPAPWHAASGMAASPSGRTRNWILCATLSPLHAEGSESVGRIYIRKRIMEHHQVRKVNACSSGSAPTKARSVPTPSVTPWEFHVQRSMALLRWAR